MFEIRSLAAPCAAIVLAASTLAPASADTPGHHAAALHALSDLRAARWYLARPAEWNVAHQERDAVGDIDRAIADVRDAAGDDGKDLDDRAPTDANLNHRGRLVRARELLGAARRDVSEYESNYDAAHDLGRARRDIDAAVAHTDRALRDREFDNDRGF